MKNPNLVYLCSGAFLVIVGALAIRAATGVTQLLIGLTFLAAGLAAAAAFGYTNAGGK